MFEKKDYFNVSVFSDLVSENWQETRVEEALEERPNPVFVVIVLG